MPSSSASSSRRSARSTPAPPSRRSRTLKPDGIFNVLFGADLTVFVREGNTRGLFEKRTVASLLTGEPEYIIPLGEETPEGWIVTGYPWEQITDAGAQGLRRRLSAKFNDAPRLGSLLGYVVGYMMKDMLDKAGSTDTDKLLAALDDCKSDTIVGPVSMRASITSRRWAPGWARPRARTRRAP